MSYNLVDRINYHSEKFKERIESQFEVSELPTDDYGWENYRYESPTFRLAHVERYFVGALAVLHITCFPHKNSKAPVFGFDVVGGIKTGKIGAVFLDYSPVIYDNKWHDTTWNKDRKLPDWATVFSKQFIAVRPIEDEYEKLFETAWDVFKTYLDKLNSGVDITTDENELSSIITNQNEYCKHQASNKRTFGALKTQIGEERAKDFMTNILFPQIDTD